MHHLRFLKFIDSMLTGIHYTPLRTHCCAPTLSLWCDFFCTHIHTNTHTGRQIAKELQTSAVNQKHTSVLFYREKKNCKNCKISLSKVKRRKRLRFIGSAIVQRYCWQLTLRIGHILYFVICFHICTIVRASCVYIYRHFCIDKHMCMGDGSIDDTLTRKCVQAFFCSFFHSFYLVSLF